jgi:putative oxidoreductase
MLAKLLMPHADRVYTIFRILLGLLFAFHGVQKVLGLLTIKQTELFSQMWFGGVIELLTGLAIAFGLQTRWAAFLASGTMAVAYIQFHWNFAMDENFFPIVNGGELAVVYCFAFLYIACKGGGRSGGGG